MRASSLAIAAFQKTLIVFFGMTNNLEGLVLLIVGSFLTIQPDTEAFVFFCLLEIEDVLVDSDG